MIDFAPEGTALLRVWRQLRAATGRRIPHRNDFRPADVVSLLPSLVVVEVLEDGQAFRYRLIGSNVVQLAGRNATGRMLDSDLYGPDLSRMIAPYRRVVREGSPVQTRAPVLFANTWRASDNLFVPFTTTDGAIDQIIVSVDLANDMAAGRDQGGAIAVMRD